MSQQPGQYINYLAVRHLVPLREQDLQYNSSTVFAINEHGIYTGYTPQQWFSTIGYTDPDTIDAKIVQAEADLQSTVAGLGSVGYISTATLASTVEGLTVYTPLSIANMREAITSTVAGLGSTGYVSTTQLESTVAGLGSTGYLSSMDGSLQLSSLTTTAVTTDTITIMDGNQPVKIHSANGVLHYGSSILGRTTTDISATSLTASGHIQTTNLYSDRLVTGSVSLKKTANAITPILITTSNAIHYSDNKPATVFDSEIYSVRRTPSTWFAYGKGPASIRYSKDEGASWTAASGAFLYDCLTITYSDSIIVAGGRDAVSGSAVTLKYSTDEGASWHNAPVGQYLHRVSDVLYNGQIWIAAGFSQLSSPVKYSTDGMNWYDCKGDARVGNPKTIAYNGSVFLIGGEGAIIASFDGGISWEHSATTTECTKIIWDGRQFIAITAEGVKLSADGKSWSHPAGSSYKNIFSNGTNYYTITDDGLILTSTDALSWSPITTPAPANPRSIVTTQTPTPEITMQNGIHYSALIPDYTNKKNQICYTDDKIIANNTLTITSGKIGIAQQNPAYPLDVIGTAHATVVAADKYVTIGSHRIQLTSTDVVIDNIPIMETALAGLALSSITESLGDRIDTLASTAEATYTKKHDFDTTVSTVVENITDQITQNHRELGSRIETDKNELISTMDSLKIDAAENQVAVENKINYLDGKIENGVAENKLATAELWSSVKSVENRDYIFKPVFDDALTSTVTRLFHADAAVIDILDSTTAKIYSTTTEIKGDLGKISTGQASLDRTQSTIVTTLALQEMKNTQFNNAIHTLENKPVVQPTQLADALQSTTTTLNTSYNAKIDELRKSVAENTVSYTTKPADPKIKITPKIGVAHMQLQGDQYSDEGIYLNSAKIEHKNGKGTDTYIAFKDGKIGVNVSNPYNPLEIAGNTAIMGSLYVDGKITGKFDINSYSAIAGSAAAPAFNFSAVDYAGSKSGIFYPETNTVAVTTNGSEKIRVTDSTVHIHTPLHTTTAIIENQLIVPSIHYTSSLTIGQVASFSSDSISIMKPLSVAETIAVGGSHIDADSNGNLTIAAAAAAIKLSTDGQVAIGNGVVVTPHKVAITNPSLTGPVVMNGIISYSAAAFGTIEKLSVFKGKNIKAVDYSEGLWTVKMVDPLPDTHYSVVVGLCDDSAGSTVLFHESGIKTTDTFQIKTYNGLTPGSAAVRFSFVVYAA